MVIGYIRGKAVLALDCPRAGYMGGLYISSSPPHHMPQANPITISPSLRCLNGQELSKYKTRSTKRLIADRIR